MILREGVKQLLREIRRKKRVSYVATSTIKEFINIIIDNLSLRKYFHRIFTAEDVRKGKPDPALYQQVLTYAHTNAEKAIVFEDSSNGIKAAQQAGIFCVEIQSHGVSGNMIKGADFQIDSFIPIIELLAKSGFRNS